jgi:hypothetical protein
MGWIRRLFLPIAMALSLSGCFGSEVAGPAIGAAVGLITARQAKPAAVVEPMNDERLDDKTKLAEAVANRLTDAFTSERLPRSTSRDTAHPNFCPMVVVKLAQIEPLDDGGKALALSCWIRYHLGKAKAIYEDHGSAAEYDDNLDKAGSFIDQLTALLDRYQGTGQ